MPVLSGSLPLACPKWPSRDSAPESEFEPDEFGPTAPTKPAAPSFGPNRKFGVMDQNVAAGLVEEWLAGPNSEASGHFSYQAVEHYRPAVLHWLTVGCGAESGLPNPELHLRPTPAALQEWAVGYAGAARSRDACGAVRSFYRWLETPAGAGGPGLVPIGTARSLQFQRGGNFAAGLLGRELWTPDQCRWLAQAADRYQGTRREGPHRARALVYLCLNHYLGDGARRPTSCGPARSPPCG